MIKIYFIIIFYFFYNISTSQSEERYIIRSGDELMKISKYFFGTNHCWKTIHLANKAKLLDPLNLVEGQEIIIPDKTYCVHPNSTYYKEFLHNFMKMHHLDKEFMANNDIAKDFIDKMTPSTEDKFYNISFQVNPIKYRRINSEKDISYSANFNYNKDLYEFSLNAERFAFSSTDELTGSTVSADDKNILMTFDVNKYFGDLTYFNLLYFNQEKSGDIYTTKYKIRAGPIGVKFDFIEEEEFIDEFSLSFIPLYEYIIENVEEVADISEDAVYVKTETNNLRASFRMRWNFKLFKNVFLKNTTFYRPAYLLDKNKFDFKDMAFENKSKITYLAGTYISLGYVNLFTYDIRQKTVHHLPSSDMEHTYLVEFHYSF